MENGESSASQGAVKSSKRRNKSTRKDSVNNTNDVADEARVDAFAPMAGSEFPRTRDVRQQPQPSGSQNHFSSAQPVAHTEQRPRLPTPPPPKGSCGERAPFKG